MKKIFFHKPYGLKITGCFLFSMSIYFDTAAQSLAINTTGATAHPSALLDVSSLNKGMLIPRIGLTDINDVTTIAAPATSLMVYNTNAAITGGSGTGFYFYTGSVWVKMIDGSTPLTGWSTTGNAATVAGTNFVGTTDLADLVFKTNGTENMRILNATGRVAINTVTATRLFQVNGDSRFQNNTYLDNNFYHYASNFGNTIFYRIAGMNNVNELTFGDNSFPNILTRFYLGGATSTNGLNFQSPAFPNFLYMDGLNGRVGINQSPVFLTRRFQVNGDSRFQNNTYIDNNFYHYASNFGNTIFYRIAGMNNVNELTFGDNSFPNILTRFYLGGATSTNGLNFQSPAFPNFLYMDGLNGRVGINQSPVFLTRRFQVNGDSRFQDNTYIDNNFYHYASNFGNTIFYRIAGMNNVNELTFGDNSFPNILTRFYLGGATSTNGLNFQSPAFPNFLYMDGLNGRVGINQSPVFLTRRFQVNGDSRFQNNTYIDNNFYHYASNFGNTIFYRIAGMNNVNELTFGDNSFPNILTRFYLGGATSTNGLNFQSPGFPNLLYMDGLNGRVGIGTGIPTHRLELAVDDAAKPGTNTWTVVSDIRMKQNIRPYKDGLTKLLEVEPVEYNYNAISGYDTRPSYVGVVAQDLQKIAPYMVGEFKKNGVEYLDINTSAMTYMMINAIKEQQKMIGELKKEIEELKKR